MIARPADLFLAPARRTQGRRCDLEAGMAKLLGARVAWANADNALQIHGGNGFALEYPISRVLCDARILNIFEGAAEIQAQVIARRLLGGAYNASKFALEGLTDTLRLELHGSGIQVSSIQPGPIRSRFTLHALNALKANIDHENSRNKALYQKRIAELEQIAGEEPAELETPEQSARITGNGWKPVYRLGPDAVLDCLIHATESANPKPYYRVTYTTRLASLARRFLPDRLQYKLMLRSS
jgi:NAD(P)-dependent dehydrogenase (short-subunit alcohol dehydrogenase family)